MITFLEFVCERLMGPPAHGSTWLCPYHAEEHASFHVRPPKQRPDGSWYPIKYKCFGCGAWGDERDLLVLFYPQESREQRQRHLEALRSEYELLTGKQVGPAISSPGHGAEGAERAERLSFAKAEWRAVMREQRMRMRTEECLMFAVVRAQAIVDEIGIPLEEFVRAIASDLIEMRAKRVKC